MRTNTRVEFEMYDVTAKADSSPASVDAQGFCDLPTDLLLEDMPIQTQYGTLETRQFLMDGYHELFPDEPTGQFWGLWSCQQSDTDTGVFADPPVLTIEFAEDHSSSGLTLHFYEPTGDWASSVKIQWYDAGGTMLRAGVYSPDAVNFYCAGQVTNYRKIVITFLATSNPGRYLKLAGLDYGVQMTFEGPDVVTASIVEECDPLSSEIRINQLDLELYNRNGDFSVINPDGVFDVLQSKQRLTVYEDVKDSKKSRNATRHNMGTFYLSEWSNTSDTTASFTAVDAIGLLDSAPHLGGIYDTTVGALIADVLDGYDYELDSSVRDNAISGYLPAGTRREALQQVAFAAGLVVDCSRSDVIKIFPPPSRPSALITQARKFSGASKVSLKTLVTGVEITTHRYTPGTEESQLYKDTLAAGVHQVTFNSPAMADTIAVSGAVLLEAGVNYANVRVETEGEVTITGAVYEETTTVYSQTAADLPPNYQENVLTVTDATLVTPDNAPALAQAILTYYAQRVEQEFKLVAGDELLADMLLVESFGGEYVRGQLEKMEFNLTSGFVVSAKLTGTRQTVKNDAYYTGELYAGEGGVI